MGFSSLAVMANSLLLQLEGRKQLHLPRPQAQKPAAAAPANPAGSSGGGGQAQQSAVTGGRAADGSGGSAGHVAPA